MIRIGTIGGNIYVVKFSHEVLILLVLSSMQSTELHRVVAGFFWALDEISNIFTKTIYHLRYDFLIILFLSVSVLMRRTCCYLFVMEDNLCSLFLAGADNPGL